MPAQAPQRSAPDVWRSVGGLQARHGRADVRWVENSMQQLPDSDQEQALDTLAALIRALPAGLRDDDDAELVRETFEKWAQHILLLTSSPGPGGVSGRRDWPGLRLAVVEHLRAEDDGAKRGIGDLRAVIGALTE